MSTSLADDYYHLEADAHARGPAIGPPFRLGDRLEVRIARVDVDRRELDLVLADWPMGRADTVAGSSAAAGRSPVLLRFAPIPSTTGARTRGKSVVLPSTWSTSHQKSAPAALRPGARGRRRARSSPEAKPATHGLTRKAVEGDLCVAELSGGALIPAASPSPPRVLRPGVHFQDGPGGWDRCWGLRRTTSGATPASVSTSKADILQMLPDVPSRCVGLFSSGWIRFNGGTGSLAAQRL